jgi:methyl-accepting chemotaxis protein
MKHFSLKGTISSQRVILQFLNFHKILKANYLTASTTMKATNQITDSTTTTDLIVETTDSIVETTDSIVETTSSVAETTSSVAETTSSAAETTSSAAETGMKRQVQNKTLLMLKQLKQRMK